jgi:RNase P/RNase MRP subunit p29
MRKIALALALAGLAGTSAAADKTYQVTGPVVDVTATTITVQKGKENWEIARSADTKASAEPKKGDKVTVQYRMTATSIEVKSDAKKAK